MVVGDAANGWPAEKLFGPNSAFGLTFDDILFLPALEAAVQSDLAKLTSRFSKNIVLKTPFVAGPGRTVCEERMAVRMALMGGIGVIHNDQTVEEQVAMVRRVKEHETAFVLTPTVVGPKSSVGTAERLMEEVGCSCLPVTDNGRMGGKLIGLITRRELDAAFVEELDPAALRKEPVTKVMILDIVTASEPVTYREAQAMMAERKVGKLPIVNSERQLVALICRGDAKHAAEHPDATRDPNAQLMVAAAVSVDDLETGDQLGWERSNALVEAGADALVVLVDEGVSEATVDFVRNLKAHFLTTDILCGRVSSLRMAEALCKVDVDGLMVGPPVGPGFEAPTLASTGGIADASVLFQVARFARTNNGIPVCAEGGVRSEADVVKACCLGASCLAPRSLLSRTSESPGEDSYQHGVRVKLRRAWDRRSLGSAAQVTVGGQIIDCGSIEDLLPRLMESLQAGFRSLGLKGFFEVPPSLGSGALRLEVCRPASSGPDEQQLQRHRLCSGPLFNRW